MPPVHFRSLLALFIILLWPLQSLSMEPDEPRLSKPGYLDKEYMKAQRASINDLSQRHLGSSFSGQKQHDLRLLQQLLDQRLVTATQTRELQAMGLIMGDLLARELGMDWVIYEDKMGRSRALRYKDSNNFLFPMTMISRRVEVDNRTPVSAIYDKAWRAIDAIRPALPYTYE